MTRPSLTPEPPIEAQAVELRACGTTGPTPAQVRMVTAADLDAVMALHCHVLDTLSDRRVLYRRERAFFEGMIGPHGHTLGIWVGELLVAYGCLGRVGRSPKAYGRALGFGEAELDRTLQLDGSGVRPEYRGRGVHRILNECRVRVAQALGMRHVLGVISLFNPPSLCTQMQCGFCVAGLYFDDDGANLVSHLDLAAPSYEDPPAEREVAMPDGEGHAAALNEGLKGFALRRDPDATRVLYGFVNPATPA